MKRFFLEWYGLFNVPEIVEKLKLNVQRLKRDHPHLAEAFFQYGLYMFVDIVSFQPIYIGQAASRHKSLRTRIRWELVGPSYFAHRLKEEGIDQNSLAFQVAHVKKALDNNKPFTPSLGMIEFPLICKMQPALNKTGKKKHRKEDVDIVNSGNIGIIPERFTLRRGQKCQQASPF